MIKKEFGTKPAANFDCRENIELYSCQKCGFTTQFRKILCVHECRRHDKLDFLVEAYKCRFCDFATCSLIVLVKHEVKCTLKVGASTKDTFFWICSHCEFTIPYEVSSQKGTVLQCGYFECCFRTSKVTDLKLHVFNVHLPDECRRFTKSSQISSHLKRTQTESQVYRNKRSACNIPPEETKAYAIAHIISKHIAKIKFSETDEKTNNIQENKIVSKEIKFFACESCEEKFKTMAYLMAHMVSSHTTTRKVEQFVCQICEFKCNEKYILKKHIINKHTELKETQFFACDECEYITKWKAALEKHKLCKHTPLKDIKWFACDKCEYKCKEKAYLNRHTMNKHTPIKDIKCFACHECQYKTKRKSDMERHKILKHAT